MITRKYSDKKGVINMLSEERQNVILKIVNNAGSVSIQELITCLHISESTARRDLLILHGQGKLNKVHGGATSLGINHTIYKADMESLKEKYLMHMVEKRKIAKYAASLIQSEDFIYIDAGSTTEQLAEFISKPEVVIMTNSIPLVQKLAIKGYNAYILPGKVKSSTESVVGSQAQEHLQDCHFTLGFFGTNGITLSEGCSTPDIEEAAVKQSALKQCKQSFILSDNSKFGLSSHFTFSSLKDTKIITAATTADFDYSIYKKVTEVYIL